jgi:hypothetical protein
MKLVTLMQAADLLDSLTRTGYEVTNRCGRLYIRPFPSAAVISALGELHEEVKLALRSRAAARDAIIRARKAARRKMTPQRIDMENPPTLEARLPRRRSGLDGTWTGAKTHTISENGRDR